MSTGTPPLDLSDRQHASVREATGRVNIWHGSIRSGKTIASLIRWLLFVATAPRAGELLMTGRTRDSVWRNAIAPLQDPAITGPAARHVVGNAGAPYARILGRRVWVIGASDAKAEAVIRGLTVVGAYIDELTMLPEAFFTQLLGRMSPTGAAAFATTNPDNPAHWLRRRFLDRLDKLPDWRVWHLVLDDNPGLTDTYIASIKAEYTGLWYRRFVLGEWVAAEGAVFSDWNPDRMVVPAGRLPAMDRLIACGIDHGVTNPSAGILVGLAAGRLYAVDEWWLDGSALQAKPTTSQQSASLAEFLARQDRQPEWIPVDPAAAAFRAQLYDDGMPGLMTADNDVHYGIPILATLLTEGQLVISDSCRNLIREMSGYSWDPKATARGKDEPIKTADHAIDALRYALVSTESTWRPHLTAHHPSAA